MFNLFTAISQNLTKPSPIKTNRIPMHMPSKAMCYSKLDNKPIGHCLRAAYLSNMQYPVSNPLGIYTIMTAEAGKLWETWLVNQYKELGIYISHSVKLLDLDAFISGEIDIVHYNPETDEVEMTECKQYNGSNYYAASELTGSLKKQPKPKDQNLLQAFDYLLMCRNTGNEAISKINLVYIDRSCASFDNNVQFRISLQKVKDEVHPRVEYFKSDGTVESYTDYRITEKAVLEKNALLDKYVTAEKIPAREYSRQYSDQLIQDMVLKKEISSARLKKMQEDPVKNPIGDWQCKFCPYGPNLEGESTCYGLKE